MIAWWARTPAGSRAIAGSAGASATLTASWTRTVLSRRKSTTYSAEERWLISSPRGYATRRRSRASSSASNGAWGSGKTSVLNLLAARMPETTTVVRFEPWLFSDADELVTRFFEEVAGRLLRVRGRHVRRLARRLADYGAAIGPTASVVLGPAGQLVAAPRQLAALSERTAAERRDALRNALLKDGQRIVVLIDDIDRLDAREVREVMRLVKLAADLPGVVHVLSYHRSRVQAALDEDGRQDGRAYLEKIMQATMPSRPHPAIGCAR